MNNETKEAGVWIDGVKLQDLGIIVRLASKEPILSAPVNRSVSISNRHGAYYFGGKLTPIEFVLDCVFDRSDDYTDLKNRITRFKRLLIDRAGNPKQVTLVFDDAINRAYRVVYDGEIDIERVARLGIFQLPLTCFDAYATSVIDNKDVRWGSEIIRFTNDDYTYGHTGGGASDNIVIGNEKTLHISVAGDDVRPRIELSGTGENVTIAWDGKQFGLGTIDGEVIVDLANYTVIRDGQLALDTITGDWLTMYLRNGNTDITITGDNMDLTFEVVFKDIFH